MVLIILISHSVAGMYALVYLLIPGRNMHVCFNKYICLKAPQLVPRTSASLGWKELMFINAEISSGSSEINILNLNTRYITICGAP